MFSVVGKFCSESENVWSLHWASTIKLISSFSVRCSVVLFHIREWAKQEAGMISYMLTRYSDNASLHSWTASIKSLQHRAVIFSYKK